jgi:hypothetical protein
MRNPGQHFLLVTAFTAVLGVYRYSIVRYISQDGHNPQDGIQYPLLLRKLVSTLIIPSSFQP